MIVGSMVMCVNASGGAAGWTTVGRMYPVLDIEYEAGEFLTIANDGARMWCRMNRFDFNFGQKVAWC